MRLPANEAGRYEMKQKTLAFKRKCFFDKISRLKL